MPKLRVSYTVTELVDVEIKDYTLTAAQIKKYATVAMESHVPICEDCSFEWVKEPKAKGSSNRPPEDFYFQTSAGIFAANPHIVVKKGFPFPHGFTIGDTHWVEPSRAKATIGKILAIDFRSLPAHKGWFSALFKPLLKLGLDVRGEDKTSLGYLLLKGELVGMLMPLDSQGPRRRKAFQFPVPILGEPSNVPN